MKTSPRTDDQTLVFRRTTEADGDAVLTLLRECLDIQPGGPYETFFDWKHRANPFGASPAWVAEGDGRIVGYRTFLRWRFTADDGRAVNAVRAVDTATHPDYRGRGIFRRLTLSALDDLAADGVDLVFNTPNDQSRPGYLSMGWQVVGRLPVAVRPRRPGSAARMLGARAPADVWPSASTAGERAADVLADPAVPGLLSSIPSPPGRSTNRSVAYLAWRYGLDELGYRAFRAGAGLEDGFVIGRVRRRGGAAELAICDDLTPTRGAGRTALRTALRESGADYAIGLGASRVSGMLPVPRLGPILTWRPLSAGTRPPDTLSLGDVELF